MVAVVIATSCGLQISISRPTDQLSDVILAALSGPTFSAFKPIPNWRLQGLHWGEIRAFAGQTRLADFGLCQRRANRPSESSQKSGLPAKIETQTGRRR